MTKPLSTRWICCGVLLLLGGCSSQNWESAAQTAQAARLFDRLDSAVRRENYDAILPLSDEIIRNDNSDFLLQWAKNLAARSDAETLNSVGYTWADKGRHRAHFEAAEILTRRALQLADENLKAAQSQNIPSHILYLRYHRAMIRDSLAWSLFKLQRFEEALREQKEAVAEMQKIAGSRPIGAEMHFHLGEIYRALGQREKARRAYEDALREDLDYLPAKKALKTINATT